MKKLIRAAGAILICAAAFACGCQQSEYVQGYEFYAMSSIATVVVYDDFSVRENKDKFNRFIDEAGQLISDIENSISTTRTVSCIYKFNQAEAGERVRLDLHAYNVLSVAQNVYNLTDGYYNPAVYYNVQAYGFNGKTGVPTDEADLPSDDEIEAYIDLYSHFLELEIYEEAGEYFAVKPQYTVDYGGNTLSMKLDLGGIGKGYAADCINKLMDDYGYVEGYFNFGSSSIALKKYKGGGNYNLGFTNPRDPESAYATVPITDYCISSSGDYENYYLLGEATRYCHVFDTQTGKPIQTGIMTATVIGGSAAENDALTTAIMAMGCKKAVSFINNSLSDRKVIFTYDGADGYFYYTNMAEGEYAVSAQFAPLITGTEDVA